MSIPKKHHYVPQTYLKKFGEKKGDSCTVHVLNKEECETSKIFSTNTLNICQEKHLYRLNSDKIDPLIIEKFFSNSIESQYDELYSILTADSIKYITQEIRAKIIDYVVIQFYRTPNWKNRHTEIINIGLERMFDLCEQTGKDYFTYENETISIRDKSLKEVQAEWHFQSKNGILITQLEVANRLISLRMKSDTIMVSKLEGESEFITSDNPVIYSSLDNSTKMPFDPKNILMIPISPKHLLMLMPSNSISDNTLIVRKKCDRRESIIEKLFANNDQYKSSERFLIGKKKGLIDYLETKEITERPATKKEIESIKSREDYISYLEKKGLL